MRIETEAERKYDIPEDFGLPPLDGAGGVAQVGNGETHELDATYFDTEDLRLARHRRTLRRRTGGTDAGWHLKTPGEGTDRTEHRLPAGDAGDDVPEELAAEVRAIVRDQHLRPVARLVTRRVETPLRDARGRVLALIAQDTVTAEADGASQNWQELEVELVDGGPKVLTAVEKRLVAAGAVPASGPSKLARALADRLSAQPRPPSAAGQVGAVVEYLRVQRDALLANDPGARRGAPDAVHDMRVATRRLRSTLRTFRGLWGNERVGPLRDGLKWLADVIGGVRDSQVMAHRLATAADREGQPADFATVKERVREHLGAGEGANRQTLAESLDDARYFRLLDDLEALVDSAPHDPGGRWARSRVRKALRRADEMLDGATSDSDRDAHLHEARKAYKRARYAVEVFVPAAGKPARQLVRRLTRLQDILGTHQDTVITRELLRDYAGRAHEAGENGFAYGVLYAHQERAGEEVLERLPAARRAARRRKVRGWLS